MEKVDIPAEAFNLVSSQEWLYFKTGSHFYFKTNFEDTLEVKRVEYIKAKYGVDTFFDDNGVSGAILTNGNTLRCFYQSSIVEEYAKDGTLIRELPSHISLMTIDALAVDQAHNLWIAESSIHRIAQFDLQTGALKFQIVETLDDESGGQNEFNYPEDIVIYGNDLYISDMGNKRIARLHIESKAVETYRTFESSIWEYRRHQGEEIVRLEDGIYKL